MYVSRFDFTVAKPMETASGFVESDRAKHTTCTARRYTRSTLACEAKFGKEYCSSGRIVPYIDGIVGSRFKTKDAVRDAD